jgi:hypothetical protein
MQATMLSFKWTEYTGPQSIIDRMKVIFDLVVEHYHDDINHDLSFLTKYGSELDLPNLDNESIRWSVGDCDSHIGIVEHGTNPLWMYDHASYNNYLHYEIQFYKNKFKLVQAYPQMTDEKYINAIGGCNV